MRPDNCCKLYFTKVPYEGHECATGNDESSVEVKYDLSYLSEFTDERLDYLMELERVRIDSLNPLDRWAEQFYPFWTEQ